MKIFQNSIEKVNSDIDRNKKEINVERNKNLKEIENIKESLNARINKILELKHCIKESVEVQTDDLVDEQSNIEIKEKEAPKQKNPKKKKITKDIIDEKLIAAYEKDGNEMFTELEDWGLDVYSQKCKKCDFETHSEGFLRQHKVRSHNIKESRQNIIIGYELDMQKFADVLKRNNESLDKHKCEQCDFKTHSEGKLVLHTLSNHQG